MRSAKDTPIPNTSVHAPRTLEFANSQREHVQEEMRQNRQIFVFVSVFERPGVETRRDTPHFTSPLSPHTRYIRGGGVADRDTPDATRHRRHGTTGNGGVGDAGARSWDPAPRSSRAPPSPQRRPPPHHAPHRAHAGRARGQSLLGASRGLAPLHTTLSRLVASVARDAEPTLARSLLAVVQLPQVEDPFAARGGHSLATR